MGGEPGAGPAGRGSGARGRSGLLVGGLTFALGVGLLHGLPATPPWAVTIGAVGLSLLLSWRWPLWQPSAFFALGLLYAHLHACALLCSPFPEEATRANLIVEGRIASLPAEASQAQRFLFRVRSAEWDQQRLDFSGLVRLSWYQDSPPLQVGEHWRLKVRLVPPHGFANPGGFDYERWLFSQGIKATGYVRADPINQLLDDGGALTLARWRQRLRDHLETRLEDETARALIQALVLGERGGLTPSQWEVLTRTGTNHLMAISGLHIGLVAAVAFRLGRWLWTRSAALSLRLAAPRAAAVAAALAALGYSALAGFAIPTRRALIMLAVVLAALFWGRTLRPFAALVLALVGVLLLDPRAVLSYGFWLSFGAVAALLIGLGQRQLTGGIWWRWGRAQWAVALGLLPMLLPFFGRASLIAPAVNLLAVPLFAVLLPMVLIASILSLVPSLGLPLIAVAELLGWGFRLLERLAEQPWAAATIAWRPTWVWVAMGIGVLLWLAPRGLPGRELGVIWLLPVLLVRPSSPDPGSAWVTILDVGQGLAAVVRTHRHVLIYDTGPAYPSGFNTGATVIEPFLRHSGIDQIDVLIVSHADNDHAGGLVGLISAIPIRRLLSGEPERLEDIAAEHCQAGASWDWDGVTFTLLHPDGPGYQGNDSSCVLRIEAGDTRLLLTGDISRQIEERLVAQLGDGLRSDVLLAAHHGSDTSSSTPFLAAVAPRYVVYTSGFANRYGFPSPSVRARVADIGALELDTGRSGAIAFHLSSNDGIAGPWLRRQDAAHLWTHQPGPLR